MVGTPRKVRVLGSKASHAALFNTVTSVVMLKPSSKSQKVSSGIVKSKMPPPGDARRLSRTGFRMIGGRFTGTEGVGETEGGADTEGEGCANDETEIDGCGCSTELVGDTEALGETCWRDVDTPWNKLELGATRTTVEADADPDAGGWNRLELGGARNTVEAEDEKDTDPGA